jgi:hypothetical protein
MKEVADLSELVRPSVDRPGLATMRRRLARANCREDEDPTLYQLVLFYRETSDPRAWALLLETVAPALSTRVSRFRQMRPLYRREDIRQEMILALHETAMTIPLTSSDWLERRLVLRAANRVSRLLKREWAKQLLQDPIEVLGEEEDEDEDS